MTTSHKPTPPGAASDQPSLSLPLLADSKELLRVRILPAEFARLLGVSKQTVSRWIAADKITVNALDGRLDVQKAVDQVIRNTDAGRLRARVLRQAVEDVRSLRMAVATSDEQIAAVTAELDAAREKINDLEFLWADVNCMLDGILALIVEREGELRACPDSEAWAAACKRLEYDAAGRCSSDDVDMPAVADLDAAAADALADLARVVLPEGDGAL